MRAVRYWAGGMIVAATSVAATQQSVAQQDSAQDSVTPSLEQRVEVLDQQVRILQRLRELAADSIAAAPKDKVSATASPKDGFSIKSADGKYAVRSRA